MSTPVKLIAAVLIVLLGGLAAVAWPKMDYADQQQLSDPFDDYLYGCDIFDPDPPVVTELGEVVADQKEETVSVWRPNEHQLRVIGRLSDGIVKFKGKQWWECGEQVTDPQEIQDRAMLYAYEIVRAADEVSDHDDDPEFVLNPWGLAGVIRNESQFDRCALGMYPRKTAYRLGLLKKKKRCISHTEDEILSVVQSEDMQTFYKKSGFDLGTAQLLSKFYDDPKDFKRMLSFRGSTLEAAYHMRKRGRIYKTKRPWLYWRGYHCEWYDAKVTRWARQLGAKPGEI